MPTIGSEQASLHDYSINKCFGKCNDTKKAISWIKNNISKINKNSYKSVMSFCDKMYEKGYSSDLLSYIETLTNISDIKKHPYLLHSIELRKTFEMKNCL